MTEESAKTIRLEDSVSHTLFESLEQAGVGGMGTVYKARDPKTQSLVAIKVLKPDADTVRFALEISALARLDHPNIVRYVGHGVSDDGRQFLAMEWLEGESLADRLRSGEPLSVDRTLEIARDIASALEHAHDAGIVHRDLKPSNVFLSLSGTKVLDFGVARISGEAGLTHTGQLVGTPAYMSPEQARGERAIDERADLFSLGCLVYHCVSGKSPFAANDTLGILSKLASHVPSRLQGVPPPLADLVERLLAKDPSDRPASARDVRKALDAILAGDRSIEPTPAALRSADDPTLASADTTATKAAPKKRWIAIALAGAASVAALAFAFRARETASHDDGAARAIAARACRTWSAEIAHRQKPNGSFTGEEHRDATGWDTAQELFSLETASSCSAVGPAPLRSAADALLALKLPGGWRGPGSTLSPTVPANAWVTLALADASKRDARFHDEAVAARGFMLAAQRDDGSFAYVSKSGEPDFYSTLLAAWALDAPDSNASVLAARSKALAWIRGCFGPKPAFDVRATAGLEEETLWILTRLRGSDGAGDDVLRLGATDLIARCALDKKTLACARPLYEDVMVGGLVLLWHPWVTAAATALAASPVDLPADVRADLRAVARWAMGVMDGSIDALAALPEYKLAEYLIAVAPLVASR